MKATFVILAALMGLLVTAHAEATPRRWAVIVGSNRPVLGRTALRYAHQDAKRLSRVLEELGHFQEQNTRLLLDPRPEEVLAVFDALLSKAAEFEDGIVLFYYSGHADAYSLYPDGAPLPLSELKKRLGDERVRLRLGIVDACRGGDSTATRGLSPEAPFAIKLPATIQNEGAVFIASSSGEQSAHESEALGGSFFTHHFVSGLRGAADDNDDGFVALSEAYAYAQRRTVRDAARYAKTDQHPSFRVVLSGRQDVSLTRLDRGVSQLRVDPRAFPLDVIHLDSERTVAELPTGRKPLTLAIDPGSYLIRGTSEDGTVVAREATLKPGTTTRVRPSDLIATTSETPTPKAADDASSARNESVVAPRRHPAREPSEVRLVLQTPGQSRMTFYRRTYVGSAKLRRPGGIGIDVEGFERLCTAPCEARVVPGEHVFGLAPHKNRHVVYAGPVDIRTDSKLHGTYNDRSNIRTLGWVLASLGAASGVGFAIASVNSGPTGIHSPTFSEDLDNSMSFLVAGTISATVLIATGSLLALFVEDSADVNAVSTTTP